MLTTIMTGGGRARVGRRAALLLPHPHGAEHRRLLEVAVASDATAAPTSLARDINGRRERPGY